jgi:hypothetical protein
MRVKSEVLKTLNVKTTGYWYVTPCSFFDVYIVAGGACCPHYLGYAMDTAVYSEMFIQRAVVLRLFVLSFFGLNAP